MSDEEYVSYLLGPHKTYMHIQLYSLPATMISRGVLALAMCLGTEAFLPSRFTGARALNRQRSTNGAAQRLNMAAEAGVPLSAEWLDNDGIANLKDFNEYETMYKRSVDDPEGFWGDIADTFHWEKKWDTVVRSNFKRSEGKIENAWFEGGITNLCYNCLDRHVEAGHGDQVSEPAGRARGAGSPVRRTSSAPRRALARREESRVTEVAAAIAPRSARATGGAWAECVVRDVRGHAPGPLAAAATPPPGRRPEYIYNIYRFKIRYTPTQHTHAAAPRIRAAAAITGLLHRGAQRRRGGRQRRRGGRERRRAAAGAVHVRRGAR